MKPDVQKSPSNCSCMELLTQPTQPSESDTHSLRAAPSMATLVFSRGRVWFRFFWLGDYFIGRRRNSVFCSAALEVAIRVAGGSPGALGDLHRGRSRCCSLQLLPVRARMLGKLTELRARLSFALDSQLCMYRVKAKLYFLCDRHLE